MNENETLPAQAGDAAAQAATPPPDLAALLTEARTLDGAPAAAAKESTALALSIATSNRGELAAALTMARDAALPLIAMLSERKALMLQAVWADTTIEAIAKNGAEVLALHGIRLDNIAGGLMPYLGLALSVGPASFATYKICTTPDPQPVQEVARG